MDKLHTQLLRDERGHSRIRLAPNQLDPRFGIGSGQLNSMSPGMWEVLSKMQERQDAFQQMLIELLYGDYFPFKENA